MVTRSGSEALGNGGAIDGGVARADHDHVAADLQAGGFDLALLDVIEAVEDVLFAGDAERGGRAQADAEEDRIEAATQIVDGEVRVRRSTPVSILTPKPADHLHFGQRDVARARAAR